MKFRFQTFMDVSTSATSMQILQFSVGGAEVVNRCRHLFGAYKYFKLGRIHVKMVPASTLPVDPLGLGYGTTDPQTVDPRDQMNPGLVRITNGEDIFTDVSSLSAGQQEVVYNSMMLDPRWSKFMLQSGFRRSAVPLYWQVGQLHQDKYPGATTNVPLSAGSVVNPTGGSATILDGFVQGSTAPGTGELIGSSARGFFQVGHRGRLGFLPTDFYQEVYDPSDDLLHQLYGVNDVPEVSVITCVLPKAYKTIYYYRIFVTEEVIFSGLRSGPVYGGAVPIGPGGTPASGQFYGLDQFMIGTPSPAMPGKTSNTAITYRNSTMNNGDLVQ